MIDKNKQLIVVVDFDGTIVEHKFPEIGRIMPNAKEVINILKDAGHTLILWTCRNGKYLSDAIHFLESNDIKLDYFNENPEWLNFETSNKIYGDVYIDDRNIGGFIGWDNVLRILEPNLYNRLLVKPFTFWEQNAF